MGTGQGGGEAGGVGGCLAEDGTGIAAQSPGGAVAGETAGVRLAGDPDGKLSKELGKPPGGGRQIAGDSIDGGRSLNPPCVVA